MASSTARAQYPVQLSVSLDEATADRIREEAAERGVSLGTVARDLIALGEAYRERMTVESIVASTRSALDE